MKIRKEINREQKDNRKEQQTTKKNLDTDLTLFTKINKKWIRPKCETQNSEFLEDNIGENLGDLG